MPTEPLPLPGVALRISDIKAPPGGSLGAAATTSDTWTWPAQTTPASVPRRGGGEGKQAQYYETGDGSILVVE